MRKTLSLLAAAIAAAFLLLAPATAAEPGQAATPRLKVVAPSSKW